MRYIVYVCVVSAQVHKTFFEKAAALQLPETEVGDLALPETTSAAPAAPGAGAGAEEEGDVVGGHSVLAPAPAARPHFRPRHRHRPPGEVVDHVRRPQVVLQLVVLPRSEDAALVPRPQCNCVGDVSRISDGFSQIARGRRMFNFCNAFSLGGVDRDCVGGAVEGDVVITLVLPGVDPGPDEQHRRGDGDAHSVLDAPPVVEVGRDGAEAEPLAHAGPVPNPPPARDVGDDDSVPGSRGALRTL